MTHKDETTTFDVSVNGGEPEKLTVRTGQFAAAAAAAPAILGIERYPVHVRIWVEDLLPGQAPFDFVIPRAGDGVLPAKPFA